MHYSPLSIRTEGLENYLNRTASKHNGFGYAELVKLTDAKVNLANIAKAFTVNRVTITKWLSIHEDELHRSTQHDTHETAIDELSNV